MCRSRSNRTDEWRPFFARERERMRLLGGWDTGDKRHREGSKRRQGEKRETFLEAGCDARPSRTPSWSAHTWPRNARSQKTRGTAIVLSAAAAKSARGSLHDRTLARQPCPIDSASLSCVFFGCFRNVISLLCCCDGPSDFSRFLLKSRSPENKEETSRISLLCLSAVKINLTISLFVKLRILII